MAISTVYQGPITILSLYITYNIDVKYIFKNDNYKEKITNLDSQ